MTLKEIKAELAGLGVTVSKRDGEFRVNLKGGAEPTAYYTNDANDALRTGRYMAERHESGAVQPFGLSMGFRDLLDAALRLRVIDAATVLGMGAEWRGESTFADFIMLCAFNNRHHDAGAAAHAELCKLNDARSPNFAGFDDEGLAIFKNVRGI